MKKPMTPLRNLFRLHLLLAAMMLVFTGPLQSQTLNDLLPVPADFKQYNAGIPHGTTQTLTYYSTTTGGNRKAMVYTPPGYSTSKKYNVFYCLHGINGNEGEWNYYTDPDVIMDNLVAKGKVAPMIVVFPNATLDAFESDLLNDLIPFIESRYSVSTGSINRALAGYSWGGGQSLNIGLGHMDKFDWVGGMASAPNTKTPAQLVPNPQVTNSSVNLIWLSCGTEDGLLYNTQNLINNFKSRGVNHVSHLQPGEHNITPWEKDFYLLTQLLFKTRNTNGGITSGSTYTITARHSGKVLDVNGAQTADGTNVQQWANSSAANQKWIITDIGNGYYRISPTHASSKSLNVSGASTADGGNVDIWAYNAVAQEQWQLVNLGNGYYQIKARNSGKCLDVNAASTANGGNVQIWTCSASANNQQWALTKVPGSAREVALESLEKKTTVSIYPNPSRGRFKIESTQPGLLQIFDRQGRLVLARKLTDLLTEISFPLPSGMYLVQLTGQNQVTTSRLLVE